MRYLVDHFGLTEEEQRLRTPSGKLVFYTRVVGTVSRLRESGLLKNTSVGKFKITEEGVGFLNSRPAMDTKPRQRARRTSGSHQLTLTPDPENPLEVLECCVDSLTRDLKTALLTHLAQCTDDAFERLVVRLLVEMGYGGTVKDAGQAIGRSHDGGIDGVIREDELGLGKIHIQAKHWRKNVGDEVAKKFVGALDTEHSTRGILITTSDFTAQAKQTCSNCTKSLVLINGKDLADYMIRYNFGVSTTDKYEIKKIDSGFFDNI